tara:strand:+ start:2712 stop:3056 length:345 start_codon:yes stop_codon:yes gene_type:complete
MAVKNTKSAKTASKAKMEVVNRIRTFFLESVNFGENTNGKKFLKGVLEGAIYGKSIDDVQPGIYTVVELSNGSKDSSMLALNRPNQAERLSFYADIISENPGMTVADINAIYGL